ncbi:kinase-like protein [Hymenopellis radicata]|nr:kinase-like protein [Hymenopellis radicata]
MAHSPSTSLIATSQPISQGAEAKVYKTTLASTPLLIKHRFHKQYRHPSLDASLTRARVAGEARALLKCLRSGVNVPGLRMVDASEGVLGLEWIDGQSIRKLIPGAEPEDDDDNEEELDVTAESLEEYGLSLEALMGLVGTEIAKMHLTDIIHGDLTTSNMMLRHPGRTSLPTSLYLIDFGLSYVSGLVEDKAVDLYVLERAFSSTHPESEPLFASVLNAYEAKMGKEWVAVKRRLDDVRLRGRKRSMVG